MRSRIDDAFERIEQSLLPTASMILDTLLDAAALARAGVDSEDSACEIRFLALQLGGLAREVEALLPSVQEPPARICA